MLHGRETGIIKRLPHGEYVEVHEPAPQAELYTLTAHEQTPALRARAAVDATECVRRSRRSDRVRARLARAMYGPGTQIPKPTAEEYLELNRGDGHH